MSQQITTQIDVQLENRNQLTALFRVILAIPVLIYLGSFSDYFRTAHHLSTGALIGSFTISPVVLALLFRGIYPSYFLQFTKAYLALLVRIYAYLLLLTDEYPSIEDNGHVRVTFPEIEGGKTLSRGMPLVKWLLAIPLYVVGSVYAIYAFMLTVVAWITVVLTGTYPEWCVYGVTGTIAYWNRVYGYAIALVTDEYPSFSL